MTFNEFTTWVTKGRNAPLYSKKYWLLGDAIGLLLNLPPDMTEKYLNNFNANPPCKEELERLNKEHDARHDEYLKAGIPEKFHLDSRANNIACEMRRIAKNWNYTEKKSIFRRTMLYRLT